MDLSLPVSVRQSANKIAWGCLRSRPVCDQVADMHLCKLTQFEALSPMLRFERIRRQGKREEIMWAAVAMFSIYFFAPFDLQNQFREIQHASGIRGVVHFGGLLPQAPDAWIEQLRAVASAQVIAVVPTVSSSGQEVTLTEGAFHEMRALVTQRFRTKERVRALLMMLERGAEVDVPTASFAADRDKRPHPLS